MHQDGRENRTSSPRSHYRQWRDVGANAASDAACAKLGPVATIERKDSKWCADADTDADTESNTKFVENVWYKKWESVMCALNRLTHCTPT